MADVTYLRAPEEGSINVESLTADTATSAIDFLGASTKRVRLLTLVCNAAVYVTFSASEDTSITDPDITNTTTDAQCFLIPANTIVSYHIGDRNRYAKFISEETCYVRWYLES